MLHEHCISFQLPVGLPENDDSGQIIYRDVSTNAVPVGSLFIGQLKGRVLPVAAALFANKVVGALEEKYGDLVDG